jgi:hypothetical protein
MSFKYNNCGTTYAALTQDEACSKPSCFGEPLVRDDRSSGSAPIETIEGLCVLVCDASRSMSQPALSATGVTKMTLVANAVERAITELGGITRSENAFIAIVAFGAKASLVTDEQGKPFIKSVRSIVDEFGTGLGHYLFDYLENDRGGLDRTRTDISAALKLALTITNDATNDAGFTRFGVTSPAKIMRQSDILTSAGRQIAVPNVRVMAYSDGAHNPADGSPLVNPFASMAPSLLMTAFIGDETGSREARIGADQMKNLATICPQHSKRGYFLINSVDRHAQLRKLFRMASGASGFCPLCLRQLTGGTIDSPMVSG